MLPSLLVSSNPNQIKAATEKILKDHHLAYNHPNLLLFEEDQKLGVEQAKKIRAHLATKPYQGLNQAVVLLSADDLTVEAQNSLLKTLEEPPGKSIIILAVKSLDHLLPTLVSRCQIMYLDYGVTDAGNSERYLDQIKKLEEGSLDERFSFIDKLENREELLPSLTQYFRDKLVKNPADQNLISFMEDLIQAQKWVDQNVTTRAILEYLMLKLPQK